MSKKIKSVSGEILKVTISEKIEKGEKNDKVKESDAGNLGKASGKEHAGIPHEVESAYEEVQGNASGAPTFFLIHIEW